MLSWDKQHTLNAPACVICFWSHWPGGHSSPNCFSSLIPAEQSAANLSNTASPGCTSIASPQLEYTHKRTVAPDSHTTAPTTGELFNAIRPLDRPLASISAHARSSELGLLSVVHTQVRYGTDPFFTPTGQTPNLMYFPGANNTS